jgi:hypothetical protein
MLLVAASCGYPRPGPPSEASPSDAPTEGPPGSSPVYVKASNPRGFQQFGERVALSSDGSTLAVGSLFEDSSAIGVNGDQLDESAPRCGAVYVFTRAGATWIQQAYVKASNAGSDDEFGAAVALSADGSTLAVGAPGESSKATGVNGDQDDDSKIHSGAVYVFTRAGVSWTQQAYIKASNTDGDDQFGVGLALSADGGTLAVGAVLEDGGASGVGGTQMDESKAASGAVYVFTRAGVAWTQQAYVKASTNSAFINFGTSLALSADGSTLAAGADRESGGATGVDGNQNDTSRAISGAVYVLARTGVTWAHQAYVKASNTGAGDRFGSGVALSADGSTLAVGAQYEGSAATGVGGNQTDNAADRSGAVYVFTRTGVTWTQEAYVKASNTDAGDQFGSGTTGNAELQTVLAGIALSADGSTLAVGAHLEDSAATSVGGDQADDSAPDSGAVYVFTRAGATWTQRAYVKATNTGAGDHFGAGVALSADGSTRAIGASHESSAATGVDGDQADDSATASGAVYVFH